MPNKMIIDASHPEETRVVVLRGNRVEEFDFESANKKPLRGNIYLAKVTRVEPSLQAAFVDYGGNRHGFLAFSEIHPDYYQIPVADRQALLEEEARSHRDEDEEPTGERRSRRRHRPRPPKPKRARERRAGLRARLRRRRIRRPRRLRRSAAPRNVEPSARGRRRVAEARGAPFVAPERVSAEIAAEVAASRRRGQRRGGVDGFAARDPTSRPTRWRRASSATSRRCARLSATRTARRRDRGARPPATKPRHAAGRSADEDEDEDEPEVTTLDGGAEERAPRARRPRGDDEGEPVEQ